jgi:VWFA-related protein
MKKLMTSCVTILLLANFVHTKSQSPMSAQEIIDRMAEVYASCRAYSDEGEVRMEYVRIPRLEPTHQYFSTAFVRPASFRFEFSRRRGKEGWDRYIGWKEGEVEKAWWPADGREIQSPLEGTLLGFGSLSSGAAFTIPSLLMPDVFRGSNILTSLDELTLAGEDKVEGRKTFKIEAKFQGMPVKLWIDQREFLVLKIYRKIKFGGMELETTTKYKPQVNGDISSDKLAMNAPSESRSAQPQAPNPGSSSSVPLTLPGLGRPAYEEAPRLRNFGSSLWSNPKDKADRKQKHSDAGDDDIIRVDTDLVVCDVLVFDKQGKWIAGLSKDDFVVREDDKPQEIGSFSLGDAKTIRRSIVLIIDYSASQLPYIKTSIEAAKMLVDKLNPMDRMAIVTDDVKLLIDFTSDQEVLKAKLESLKTSALSGGVGRSEQYDALMATLKELFAVEDHRPIIIFQTDGDQLYKLKGSTLSSPYTIQRNFSLGDVMTAAEKARATIYSIIPGIRLAELPEDEQLKRAKTDWENRSKSNSELRRLKGLPGPNLGSMATISDANLRMYSSMWIRMQVALVGIANFSGGWTDFLEQPEQADEVYTRILNDINMRYIIGYYPTNRTRDGKRRKVSLEVRGHPEYIVWGRKTYFSPEPE